MPIPEDVLKKILEGSPSAELVAKVDALKLDAQAKELAKASLLLAEKAGFDMLDFYGMNDPAKIAEQVKKSGKLDDVLKLIAPAQKKEADPLEGLTPAQKAQFDAMKAEHDAALKKLEQAEDERKLSGFVAKAAAYGRLPIKADGLGAMLKAASEKIPEHLPELERVLKAANEQAETLFVEKGIGGEPEPTSYEAEMNRLVVEKRKADPKMSEAEAQIAVMKENPKLYDQHVAKMRGEE